MHQILRSKVRPSRGSHGINPLCNSTSMVNDCMRMTPRQSKTLKTLKHNTQHITHNKSQLCVHVHYSIVNACSTLAGKHNCPRDSRSVINECMRTINKSLTTDHNYVTTCMKQWFEALIGQLSSCISSMNA